MAEMMGMLQGIGYGIVAFAILVVVGTVVISRLGGSIADCTTSGLSGTATYDQTAETCTNTTDTADPTNTAWVGSDYLGTQLGSSGLSGWVPAIIAVAVGALFLSYFMGKRR